LAVPPSKQGIMSLTQEYPQFKLVLDHPYAKVYQAEGEPHLIKWVGLDEPLAEVEPLLAPFSPRVTVPGLVFPQQLRLAEGELLLLFENCPFLFLPQVVQGPLELGAFLGLAIELTQAVAKLHKQNLVHKDLTPFNILVDPNSGRCVLTGLYFDEHKNLLNQDSTPLHSLGEAFVYSAPEQTGRINRETSKASDLYALGVILFEYLTGHPPFSSKDQLELIHSHIALAPPSPSIFRPELPPVVEQILLRLLAKTDTDRYQDAQGLLADLWHCQRDWQEKGRIEDFPLEASKSRLGFVMPARLYGVEEHRKALVLAFQSAASGGVEMVLIKGAAGLGKSSLVGLLKEPIQEKGGLILEGRFEKQHKDTPYYCLREAFERLVNHLLTQDEAQLTEWRQLLDKELGENLGVLAEFLPDLRLILGPHREPPRLDPLETQNRLGYSILRFLNCFTKGGKPLVIFLDNFHFADSASLLTLQNLITDLNSRHLLMMVAYRDSLAIQSGSLNLFLEEIAKSGVPQRELSVRPLHEADLRSLLAEAFGSEQDFEELVKLLLDKTNGNPFFVKQLLGHLSEQDLITWDPQKELWVWDLPSLHKACQSKDVIDLLITKIKNLHEKAIETLKTAACIGTQFERSTLALGLELSEEELDQALEELLQKGMIFQETRAHGHDKLYHFLHNRIHLAASSLWVPQAKRKMHLAVGRKLLRAAPEAPAEDWIFKTVNQLNQAVELIEEWPERHQLAWLNLKAGDASRAIAAYETAWNYYTQGTELLSPEAWELDYGLAKELFVRRAEAEYYTGNTEAFKPIFQLLYDHLRTDEEKEAVISIKLNLFIKAGDLKQALEIGTEAINHFSKQKIPPNDAEISIVGQVLMQEMQARISAQKLENLLYLNEMDSNESKALMKLFTSVIPAAYFSKRSLWVYLTLKMVENSLNQGNCAASPFGYMHYAILLCCGLEDYQKGFGMGKLALTLNRKLEIPSQSPGLNFLFGAFVCHWKASTKESLDHLNAAAQQGVRFGDFIAASGALGYLVYTHLVAGTPLDGVALEIKKNEDFALQAKNPDLDQIFALVRLFLTLKDPESELPNPSDTEPLLKSLKASRNPLLLQWYHLILAQLYYFLGDYPKSLQQILKSDGQLRNYGQLSIPEHYFYFSLVVLANYPHMSFDERKRYWDILKGNRDKLRLLSSACEQNFLDRYLLVCAEMSATGGNFIETIDLYDKAIAAAKEQGRPQIQGLANELAARYYLSKNKTTIALAYLKEAQLAYRRWGAGAKLARMPKEYLGLLESSQEPVNPRGLVPQAQQSDLTSLARLLTTLDFESDPGALIRKLLKIMLETAGAQRGYFLVEQEGHFRIRAEGNSADNPEVKLCSLAFEDCNKIAHTVVSFVIRTKKTLVLGDAGNEVIFGYDPYVVQEKPKSILAMPMMNQSRLVGILYLENNLATQAFSKSRAEFLGLLVGHVALSLENAFLTATLTRNQELLTRTRRELETKISDLETKLGALALGSGK